MFEVKRKALINASYLLSLAEKRMLLMAINSAHEQGEAIDSDTQLKVYASAYAGLTGAALDEAYDELVALAGQLRSRQFSFSSQALKVSTCWVQQTIFCDKEKYVSLLLSSALISEIPSLLEQLTRIDLDQVSKLTSKYAVYLYEFLSQWLPKGKTPLIEISNFREEIGVKANEYQRMHHFKSKVLDFALEQINSFTDLEVKYTQHKTGRIISHLCFSVKSTKPQIALTQEFERDPNTVDAFSGTTDAETAATSSTLTEKQRRLFADRLSKHPGMSSYSNHNTYAEFSDWLFNELADPKRVEYWMPYLVACGFNQL